MERRNISQDHIPSLYWKCQFLGWGLASLYWAYVAFAKLDYTVLQTCINFLFDVLIGIALTHSYKLAIPKFGRKSYPLSPLLVALSIGLLAIAFMFLVNLKWFIFMDFIKGGSFNFLTSLTFWDPPLITGLRMMCIWVLAFHLYHYYQEKMALTAHNAELAILAKQIQVDQLTKQLNPHFLFNSLNSVKSLVSENPSKAKRAIDLLSDILRSSLYGSEGLTTVENEIALIKDYVELEKLRFEERLQLIIDVDQLVLGAQIPYLCIQTLVENAIKHGIQNSISGGSITLTVADSSEDVVISVQSPGSLAVKKDEKDIGVGLSNLKKRLNLEYKDEGRFILKEGSAGKVTATIRIPKK